MGESMSTIRRIIWKLTWREKLCESCSNAKIVSNFSPCYGCKLGSNYEKESKNIK
jgi:hypothetical protein